MSEKLISAKWLIQFVGNWGKLHGREEAADSFLYAIRNAPAVEVVWCKDCVDFYPKDYKWNQHCRRTGTVVYKKDFCSFGERREENAVD